MSLRLALCTLPLLVGCGAPAPGPGPEPRAASDGAAERPAAEQYAIGDWHLGKPLGAFARSKPDLWGARGVEMAPHHGLAVVTIGARHPDPADVMNGAHLAFVGPSFDGGESVEESFVPVVVIALGDRALELFRPSLPLASTSASPTRSTRASGAVGFVVEQPMREDGDPARPEVLRLECYTSRVCSVTADGQPLGHVLGAVPRDPGDRFYKALRRYVETHLHLR